MAVIRIDEFKGIAPAISPLKLANGAAQTASNAKIVSSSLVPEKSGTLALATPANTKSVFKANHKDVNGTDLKYWVSSTYDEDFAQSPVNNDVWQRIYKAGGTYPVMASFVAAGGASATSSRTDTLSSPQVQPLSATYRLGVPKPTSAPVVTASASNPGGTWAPTGATGEETATTSYVYTVVTGYGEEGPPSPPCPMINYVTKQSDGSAGNPRTIGPGSSGVQFTNYNSGTNSTAINSDVTDRAIGGSFNAKIRIYRTATGTDSTEFLFVGEENWSTTWSHADSKTDGDLGEVLSTTYHFEPPNENRILNRDGPLQQLVPMSGGFFAGFTGRTVMFSEQFLPHAWPPQNSLVVESDIVAIKETTYGLIVLTKTRPYVCAGTDPGAMSVQLLDIDQACVSKRSVADLGGMVVYASPDGLVGIEGQQTRLLTDGIITRDHWEANYYPTTMHSAVFERRYYGFFDDGNGYYNAIVFDPKSSEGPIAKVTGESSFDANIAVHVSAEDDKFYYATNGNLYEWGTGANKLMNWKSKKFFTPTDMPLCWGRVLADGDVLIRIYVDSFEVFEDVVMNNRIFRLPPLMRGREIEVEVLNTNVRVDAISLGTTREEL